jgi:hypothetical protein
MATLTPTEILSDIMDAIRVEQPALSFFSTDFTNGTGFKRDQQVIAHIRTLPSSATYNASTGYANGAAEANTLVEDVPVTLDNHKHVPIKVDYLNAIADKKDIYQGAISDAAYVLCKEIVDDALAEVVAANFTAVETHTEANSDYDAIEAITKKLNENGASPRGRKGIVNSGVASTLGVDARVASRDYSGQQRKGNAYARFMNVGGFEDIIEYPDLPANSENLTGFFFDKRAVVVATALPDDSQSIAQSLGIPTQGRFFVEQDPVTGMQLMGILWQAPGTFDLYLTVTMLWGVAAGMQGGSAGEKSDYAGCRLVSA